MTVIPTKRSESPGPYLALEVVATVGGFASGFVVVPLPVPNGGEAELEDEDEDAPAEHIGGTLSTVVLTRPTGAHAGAEACQAWISAAVPTELAG
mmetsp:Transcript_39215/g.68976  ORF Transcript_39215/g.68976 Transcript_39215/m.68976 type:complete len:95 (-) Transcript_39215:4-288(-)